jgi:hypothetical protein
MFEALLDDMRTHSSEWLESRRREVVDALRRLRSEELAIRRVSHEPHDSCSPRCDDVRPGGRTLPSCAGAGRSPS